MSWPALRDFLRDGRRSQRGSVLSGVLLITAFVAILSGALMTTVSTNVLLSASLTNRVAKQAAVNSAMELSLGQMQAASIYNGCPALSSVTLNGIAAATSYTSCAPTFDSSTTPAFRQMSTASVTTDATAASVALPGGTEYLLADSAGTLYRFPFGSASASWSVALGGSTSGPPEAMPDGRIVLVPVTNPTMPATPGCGASGACVAVLDDTEPTAECYLAANGGVTSRPASGVNFSTVAFFGDQAGNVWAYNTAGGSCVLEAGAAVPAPVVAGPFVFKGQASNQSTSDEVFFLTSGNAGTSLIHYTYAVNKKGAVSFFQAGSLALSPGASAGVAADRSQLPVRLAITFTNGTVKLATISTGFGMSLSSGSSVPATVAGGPTWCCGAAPTQIGVAQRHGFYVFDAGLNLLASYSFGTASLSSAPAVDGGGDWFVGADDGNIYEIPAVQTSPTVIAFGVNEFGDVQSVQVGQCGNGWVCAYIGSSTQNSTYLIQLDARSAVLSACVSTAPPACSGSNPRLWASVQVGAFTSTQAVRILGWSYYSP